MIDWINSTHTHTQISEGNATGYTRVCWISDVQTQFEGTKIGQRHFQFSAIYSGSLTTQRPETRIIGSEDYTFKAWIKINVCLTHPKVNDAYTNRRDSQGAYTSIIFRKRLGVNRVRAYRRRGFGEQIC